jgi:hypothetical protein
VYWIVFLLFIAPLGCTATCIRDSDCLGASVCSENRCLLIVRGDAGRPVTTPPASEPDVVDGDPAAQDGGATQTAETTGN